MSANGSGAALNAMGMIPKPLGTLEELRKGSLNPARVASCSAPDGNRNKGCDDYHRCIFKLRRNGGFRDTGGPLGVGYYLETHEGTVVENEGPCWWFMERMFRRMTDGQRDRQEGKNGETIQIIAIEPGFDHPLSGEVISRRVFVDINEGKGLPAKFEPKTIVGPVSHFRRLGEREAMTYEAEVRARRLKREQSDPDYEEGALRREAVSQPHASESREVDVESQNLDAILKSEPAGPAAVAAPVTRKSA